LTTINPVTIVYPRPYLRALCRWHVDSLWVFSLIDRQRQWLKSNHGLHGIGQTSRDIAFCAHTILDGDLLEIPDATRDARFQDNPLVADALMENAVRLVSETLGFEHCRVLELAQGGLSLLSRATVGPVPDVSDSGSRVAALISGPQGSFGLLEVRSALASRVTAEVTNFVQSVANIIGTALARRRADEQLAYAARFDTLTGLPNRQLFRDRISQSIARAVRKSRPIAVVGVPGVSAESGLVLPFHK
jgi:GAF domain-containing protein